MPYLPAVVLDVFLAVPSLLVELFRYRYHAEDGAELEYVFETDEQSVQKTVDKENAVEIGMATFYGVQVGTMKARN